VLVVDASALLAFLLGEPDADLFRDRLLGAEQVLITPVNLWEVAVRLRAKKGGREADDLPRILAEFRVQVVPTDQSQAWAAAEASRRFGRGTPARLNLGDCFAYALATAKGLPLLYKGDDFAHTDVRPAL